MVGRPVASVPGFAYSDALKKHHGPWTYAEIFQWIKDPAQYAPGTKMTFAGLPDPKQRADVISFLRTLSDHPEPLPPAPGGETAAKAGAAKAVRGRAKQPATKASATAPAAAAAPAPAAAKP